MNQVVNNPEILSDSEIPKEAKELLEQINKPQSRPELLIGERGILPRNIEELFRFSSMLVKSGLLPDRFKSPESVAAAIQLCMELGLPVMSSLRFIAVIRGQLALFGELPLAIVMGSGKLESIKEFPFNKEGKEISINNNNLNDEAFGAYCEVRRKGIIGCASGSFTLDDKFRANLASDTWQKYPKIMMKFKARSIALKGLFDDILLGCSIAEYDDLYESSKKKYAPADNEKLNELNERLKSGPPNESISKPKDEIIEPIKPKNAGEVKFSLGDQVQTKGEK
jgi:hypothetical protein